MTSRILGPSRHLRGALVSAVVLTATLVLPAIHGVPAVAAPDTHTHPVHPVHGAAPGSYKGDVRDLPTVPSGPLTDPGVSEPEPSKSGGVHAGASAPVAPNMPATAQNFDGLGFQPWGAGWPPGHGGRCRAEQLRGGRQHVGWDLQQDRYPAGRVHVQLAVGGGWNRDILRHRQRRRPDRRVRPDRRSLVRRGLLLDESRFGALLRVRRRFEDRRPGVGRMVALRHPGRRCRAQLAVRLSEDGHLARWPLHVGEHVRLQFHFQQRPVQRRAGLRLQPDGPGGRSALLGVRFDTVRPNSRCCRATFAAPRRRWAPPTT